MSILDRVLDLLPMRRVRPERWPPVVICGSPPLTTEIDLASFLLTQPGVLGILAESGFSAASITSQLNAMKVTDEVAARETVQMLASDASAMHPDPAVAALLLLLCRGTDGIRSAMTPPGRAAGDIAFNLAHGQQEGALRALWAEPTRGGSVEILNDPVTPLELAASGLERALNLAYEDSYKLAFRVHEKGVARLPVPAHEPAHMFCTRANSTWRHMGLALYCQPSLLEADDDHPLRVSASTRHPSPTSGPEVPLCTTPPSSTRF